MTEAERHQLEDELANMDEHDVARALNDAPLESEAADIIAGEMERRNLDD